MSLFNKNGRESFFFDGMAEKTGSSNSKQKLLTNAPAIFFVLMVGFVDFISGYEISFSICYLIPVSWAVYYGGFRFGIFVSIMSSITWYYADKFTGHTYSHAFIPVWNAIMRLGYFILHTYFMSMFLNFYKKAEIDSLTDSLTGLLNRRYFFQLFEKELSKSKRKERPFTLVYLDLDNFKAMNDTQGHNAGDCLLKGISDLVKKQIRPSDIFARLGGDEFVLLFPETDYNSSELLIKRLQEAVAKDLENNKWPVTLSIGAVTFTCFNHTSDEMIKMTDDLMYDVKKTGKNAVRHILKEN